MSSYRHKWTLGAILEEFSMNDNDLAEAIELGLLLPDNFHEGDNWKRFVYEGYTKCQWSDATVQRYRKIAALVKDQQLYFYKMALARIVEMEANLKDEFAKMHRENKLLRDAVVAINTRFDKQEMMIDAHYFCRITGYKYQTFRNNVQYMDEEQKMMRLTIDHYKNLVWHKIGNKWQTPLSDFQELRANFNYQVFIDEKKRTGKFTPKVRVNINEL